MMNTTVIEPGHKVVLISFCRANCLSGFHIGKTYTVKEVREDSIHFMGEDLKYEITDDFGLVGFCTADNILKLEFYKGEL